MSTDHIATIATIAAHIAIFLNKWCTKTVSIYKIVYLLATSVSMNQWIAEHHRWLYRNSILARDVPPVDFSFVGSNNHARTVIRRERDKDWLIDWAQAERTIMWSNVRITKTTKQLNYKTCLMYIWTLSLSITTHPPGCCGSSVAVACPLQGHETETDGTQPPWCKVRFFFLSLY